MSLAPTTLANFPQAVPDSAGIPEGVRDEMLIAPFNGIESVKAILDEFENEVAAIIVEPLQRVIPPQPGFLQALRDECTSRSIVLIFDEIVTGFRLAYGGAQERYGVIPDVCTLGKVIGGGFPLAAIAGSKTIMGHFDKAITGDRYLMQLGTLAGNPVAAIAGLKTMEILRRDNNYEKFINIGQQLMNLFSEQLDKTGHAYQLSGDPTLFDVVFSDANLIDYSTSLTADTAKNPRFNQALREHGVFKSPGKLYPSLVINDDDLQVTHDALVHAVAKL